VLFQYARNGIVTTACPVRVIEDSSERVVVYWPVGVEVGRHSLVNEFRSYSRHWTETNVVMITEVGAAHSVWAMWLAELWEFHCWYVNLQDPIRRTWRGYLSRDHSLDVVIYADDTWRWKDEGETEDQIERGVLTRQLALLARAEGEAVLKRWRAGGRPFSEGWPEWRPDPGWPIPDLPPDWREL
jgi:hypothetical protein